jgi:vanillate O-demethylase ferredoxin subunit
LRQSPFAEHVHCHFDDRGSRLDAASVLGSGQPGTHVYTCGPSGFMEWIIASAQQAGYADAQIHREYFQVEVDTGGDSFEVIASRSGKTVQVAPGQTIVEALASVGIEIEMSCEQGVCGTCLCDVLEGEPDHRDVYLTDHEKAANDQILACCSRARSPRLVLDI